MADALRIPRIALGVLTLGAGVPLAAVEWSDLAAERDDLAAEVERLEAELERRGTSQPVAADASPRWSGHLLGAPVGSDLDDLRERLASAEERQVELTTEAAALRRRLASTRAALDTWERREGALDMELAAADAASGSAEEPGPSQELVDLSQEHERTRRRLAAVQQEHESIEVEREEALAQLRREMFSNLQYSAIIGECGHRTSRKAFEGCSNGVRDALRPHWDRFESCVRDYNAIPAYTERTSAQDVAFALQLDRGAVLMCDPRLPDGSSR